MSSLPRTRWPLLNQARRHGLLAPNGTLASPNTRGEMEVLDHNLSIIEELASGEMVAVHVGTPCGLLKKQPDLVKNVDWAGLRIPFTDAWYEWPHVAAMVHVPKKRRAQVAAFTDQYFVDQDSGRELPVAAIGEFDLDKDRPGDGFMRFAMRMTSPTYQVTDHEYEMAAEATDGLMQEIIAVLGFAWALLECNNVEVVETQPTHRTHKAQKDPARVVHRTLQIDPFGKQKRSQRTASDEPVHGRALHIRRGCFRDYTKGNGLFGKYRGRYWVGPHMVGDQDYGTVRGPYVFKDGGRA